MLFSLTIKEYLRLYVKLVGRISDYFSFRMFNTSRYGDYANFIYILSQNSTNEQFKKEGKNFYKEISQESRENVTIGNVLLSVYDYYAGTTNDEMYDLAINGNIEAFNILLARNIYKPQNIVMSLMYKSQFSLLGLYLKSHKELATKEFYTELTCFAVSSNDNAMLNLVLNSGVNLDIDCYNKPILVIAVKNNHLLNVKTLIENNVYIPDNIIEYALYDRFTTSGVLPYLISQGIDINHQFSNNYPILMAAISGHQYITAQFLIKHHAELNFWLYGKTPLSEAINLGTNSVIIKELIRSGADVGVAVQGSKILKDMIQAPYITENDKIDIIPLILCKGNYSKSEVADYISITNSENIKSELHSYVYSKFMICNIGTYDNQEDYTGLSTFYNTTDS